jgi:pimeloyl-ACP methyl ester carboxylesterase
MAGGAPPPTGRTAELADGRLISWAEYGDPSGRPLLLLHGTPGSRFQYRWMDAPAAAAGIRLITPERPGYGASDPVPGGVTFVSYADDLRQLLDRLEVEPVTLAGASGGGGFALAAAIVHPARYARLLLVSAGVPAPRSARRRQALPVRLLLFLAVRAPGVAGKLLAGQQSADLDAPISRAALRLMPASDRRVLSAPEWRDRFADDIHEAMRQGTAAAVRDLALGGGPLGVDLADLVVETVLLHGAEDVNVPVGIARWVAARVPTARLVEQPGAGHLFVLERPELLFEWVV